MNAQDCKNIAVSRPSPWPYAEIQTSGFLYSSGKLKAAWAKPKPSWGAGGGGGGACPEACSVRKHRRECPAITYMAMGFRPRSFPVGGMCVKGIGRLTKVKKNHSLLFSIAS